LFLTVLVAARSGGFPSLLVYSPVGLWRALHRFRPDIVLVEEEPWSLAALEVLLICRRLGAQFVFFTWENVDRRLPPPFEWIRGAVMRHAAAAVAGSVEAKRLLERHGFQRAISVLPQLGVDPVRFSPVEQTGDASAVVVGFVGRLVPQKGVLLLLDAIARVPPAVQILVVGSGPLKNAILARARALGLNGRLEVREDVRHDQVPHQLRRMSVLVLPSLTTPTWKEQFGHVLIEAMACGVPVVGSDSGAIPEVIGDAGLVVPEGDVQTLAATLQSVVSTPVLRAQLASRGRARVLAEYTNDTIALRLAAVCRDVVFHV
jgi:glycosyltransferase involved in cell wall biosynthesis